MREDIAVHILRMWCCTSCGVDVLHLLIACSALLSAYSRKCDAALGVFPIKLYRNKMIRHMIYTGEREWYYHSRFKIMIKCCF